MSTKFIKSTSILLALGSCLWAQNLQGSVKDKNAMPLVNTQIQLKSSANYVLSDAQGFYQISSTLTPLNRNSALNFKLLNNHIQWTQNQEAEIQFRIFDLNGKILWTQNLLASQGSHDLNIPEFNFTSFLVVETKDQTWMQKLTPFNQDLYLLSSVNALQSTDSLICTKSGYQRSALAVFPNLLQYDFILTKLLSSIQLLPETGISVGVSAVWGEDNDYQGHALNYQKNPNNTVTDLNTGLIWQRGESPSVGFGSAKQYCDTLSLASLKWRLPDPHEAYSIQNLAISNPSIDTSVFGASQGEYWWTGTLGLERAGRVWITNMGGGIGAHDTLEAKAVGGTKLMTARCVSGLEGINTPVWTILGDSVARDENTGLEWVRFVLDTTDWESALTAVENLVVASKNDWRMPNIKELQSINDESRFSPSLDTLIFPTVKSKTKVGAKAGQITRPYWSSSPIANHPELAWNLDFNSGLISYVNRTTVKQYTMMVRGGK